MTDLNGNGNGDVGPLPDRVAVSGAFTRRLPSQRILDLLARLEPAAPFAELATTQPFRIIAFRALLRDHPDRDAMSLWMAAYDVEVDVEEADPLDGSSLMPPPRSAATTG
jgi:hypothetical protein